MKRLFLFLSIVLCSLSVFASGIKEASSSFQSEGEIRAILLTDATGIDDKSFNLASWRGILEFYGDDGAGKGKLYDIVSVERPDDFFQALMNAAEDNWDLIITTGFTWADAVEKAQVLLPEQKMVIIDVDNLNKTDNLIQYVYEEEQGAYLVGVLCASEAKEDGIKSPKFGFIGGIPGATITKFEIGYIEGVKSVFPDAEIVDCYVDDWGNPDSAEKEAEKMYESGVYAIFAAAGGSGLGVIKEAKKERLEGKNVWAVGVDSDQYEDGIYADGKSAVLTSMIKRVENSVVDALTKVKTGTWEGGIVIESLSNEGVGYSKTNTLLREGSIEVVDRAKADILSGKIVVNKTYEASKKQGLAPAGLAAVDD